MRRSEPQYPSPIRNQLLGGSATAGDRIEGWLFDIDELGPWVTLWVYDDDGRLRRLTDEFHPPVYAHGDRAKLKQLAADMTQRSLLFCACARSAMLCWDEVLIDVALNRYKLVYA